MATGDLQARRQQLLKQKLERRLHDRKMAKQHKKRAIIIRLYSLKMRMQHNVIIQQIFPSRDIRALTENNSSIMSGNQLALIYTLYM